MKILIVRLFPDELNINNYNVQEIGLAKALVKKGHVCDIVLYTNKKGVPQTVHSTRNLLFSFIFVYFSNFLFQRIKKSVEYVFRHST